VDIAVLWDLDGTLADTEQAHFTAWQALVREYGRELSWDEFKPTFGLGNPDILHMLIDASLEEQDVERLSQHKEQLFRDMTGGAIAPMPGARDLVEHLHGLGIRQAIASSAPTENIAFILRALDLDETFATTVSRWQVPNGKPFPDIFLRAAANLHMPPAQCVVLEDAPAGVQAAHAGGMRCIALVSTWPAEALAGAELLVRDLSTIRWPRDRWEAFVTGSWRPGPSTP
jgi:beta-phosphoglucomutase family hydrolase